MNQLNGSCENLLISLKNTKLIAITAIGTALMNTVLNFALIPHFGAYGAAIATVVALSFQWVLRFVVVKKLIRLKNNTIIEVSTYSILLFQMIIAYWGNRFIAIEVLLFVSIVGLYAKSMIPVFKKF